MYWLIIPAALVLLVIIMLVRAAALKKPATATAERQLHTVDKVLIAKHLSDALKIPTVSMVNEFINNSQPFYDFHKYLKDTYPLITKRASVTVINGFSLVYKFEGKDKTLRPGAFLAHQDVVPAAPEGWEVPPFSGTIADDGFIYGRGAMDMKSTLIGLMEAMETLINEDFKPERDLYFCFGHDEEPMASREGAPKIVEWFKQQDIELEFVIDEGGTVFDGKMLGINGTVALIGTCEKGYCDYKLTCEKKGGHASYPTIPSNLGTLGKAICKLEKNLMKPRWTAVTKDTFRYLAPHMSFPFKTVMANRDLLSWLLKPVLTKIPLTSALMRTTFAATMIEGNVASNVLPPVTVATVNSRIIPGQTVEGVAGYIQKVIGKEVKVSYGNANDPTVPSPTDNDCYKNLIKSIDLTFKDFVTAPYMFIAGTDSRYYSPICKNVYRFTPIMMSLDDQKRVHALNERISVDAMEQAVQFFINCIKTMA